MSDTTMMLWKLEKKNFYWMFNLQNKKQLLQEQQVVLVKPLLYCLQKQGAQVHLLDMNEEGLAAAVAEITKCRR